MNRFQKAYYKKFNLKVKIIILGVILSLLAGFVFISNSEASTYFKATGVVLLIYLFISLYQFSRELDFLSEVDSDIQSSLNKIEVLENKVACLEKELNASNDKSYFTNE